MGCSALSTFRAPLERLRSRGARSSCGLSNESWMDSISAKGLIPSARALGTASKRGPDTWRHLNWHRIGIEVQPNHPLSDLWPRASDS